MAERDKSSIDSESVTNKFALMQVQRQNTTADGNASTTVIGTLEQSKNTVTPLFGDIDEATASASASIWSDLAELGFVVGEFDWDASNTSTFRRPVRSASNITRLHLTGRHSGSGHHLLASVSNAPLRSLTLQREVLNCTDILDVASGLSDTLEELSFSDICITQQYVTWEILFIALSSCQKLTKLSLSGILIKKFGKYYMRFQISGADSAAASGDPSQVQAAIARSRKERQELDSLSALR